MEIIKDKITGIEYVDFDDVLDEKIELDNITKLIINGELNEYIHNLIKKFIYFNSAISSLKYQEEHDIFSYEEIIIYKNRFKELYYDLKFEYNEAKEHDGLWKYINNYTIKQVYTEASPYENLQLSDIFENDNFYSSIINIKRGKENVLSINN